MRRCSAAGDRAALAVLTGLRGLFGLLPYRAALAVGWGLALLSRPFAGRALRRAEARILQVFQGRMGRREARRIARRAWRNMAFNTVEVLRAPRATRAWMKRVTDFSEAGVLFSEFAENRRPIVALPHLGSWELSGQVLGLLGARPLYITRRQKSRLLSEAVDGLRSRQGQVCLDRDDPLLVRKVVKAIRSGHTLCILPDIRAREGGIPVRFLGRNTVVGGGTAVFSRLSGRPVLPACSLRVGWARHRWVVFDPVRPDPAADRDEDIRRMTREIMDRCTEAVRQHPDQYFWFNKKWLFEEPGDRAGKH